MKRLSLSRRSLSRDDSMLSDLNQHSFQGLGTLIGGVSAFLYREGYAKHFWLDFRSEGWGFGCF